MIIGVLTSLIVVWQAKTVVVTPPDVLAPPALPSGCNSEYQDAVFAVESKLELRDFEGAKRLLWMLPQNAMTIDWDDSKLPEGIRPQMRSALDAAIKDWKRYVPGFSAEVRHAPGGLKIDFESVLSASQTSNLPSGLALLFSQAPGDARLEAVIGMRRGSPLEPTTRTEVLNEIHCALGSYLGLATSPLFGTYMGRSDVPTAFELLMFPREIFEARAALAVADQLRQAVADKKQMMAGRADMLRDPAKLELPEAIQGDPADFSIQLSNRGNAPLSYRLTPDCSCFALSPPGELAPGTNILLRGRMNTTEYSGDVRKTLLLATSDPSHPMTEIPLTIHIRPRYEMIAPTGIYAVASDAALTYELYLCVSPDSKIVPTGVTMDGSDGTVEYVPWSGDLADADRNEPVQRRKGFKFTIQLDKKHRPGRVPVTLSIQTNNDMFKTIYYSFYVQKGIVALPDRVFFGEMGGQPMEAKFLLSRPQTGFNVTKIESDNPCVTVTQRATRGTWEHEFLVKYNGKAVHGAFNALIHITTSDPKQPVITVSVDGIVQ